MSKKTVLITCVILVVGTLLTVGLLYQSDASIADYYMAQYRKVTQDFQRTTVSTYEELEQAKQGTPGLSNGSAPGIVPGISGTSNNTPGANPNPNMNLSGAYTTTAANGLYYVPQTGKLWDNVTHTGSGTWTQDCCALIALYCAAANTNHTTEDMGVLLARLNDPVLKLDNNGILRGTSDNVGESKTHWNNILGATNLTLNGPKSVGNTMGYPKGPGDYIMYISHSKTHDFKNGATTNAHWIYVKIDDDGARIANPANDEKDWSYKDYAGERCLIKYYKVS